MGNALRITLDPDLAARVSLDPGALTAAVHLCGELDCELCPEQTAERVRAEIEAQAVLADLDTEPDWPAIGEAVDALRPVLDDALCRRMVPGLGSSLGVPADMAETSDVLPSLHSLPLAEALGGATATLLAPPARDLDATEAYLPSVMPPPAARPALSRHTDPFGLYLPPEPPEPRRDDRRRGQTGHGWARTGVLAAVVLAVGLGGGTVVKVVQPFGPTAPPAQAGEAARVTTGGPAEAAAVAAAGGRTSRSGGPVASLTPTPGAQGSAVVFQSCAAAAAAGAAPIRQGAAAYRPALDADHDGIACEAGSERTISAPIPTASGAAPGPDQPTGQDPEPAGTTAPPPAEPTPAPTEVAPPPQTDPPQPDQPSEPAEPTASDPGGCVVDVLGLCISQADQGAGTTP